MRVLVVEDEPKMQALLVRGLEGAGYAVARSGRGDEAVDLAARQPFDLIVLDVLLPGMDGFRVVRELRARDLWTPVLMLTAVDTVEDRVHGLDSGADDYLAKPFAFEELLGRIRALLRRSDDRRGAVLRYGPLVLDPAAYEVTCDGDAIELSAREFALLELLMRERGRVLTRAQIIERVWGDDYNGFSNVVDVYVRYLRNKVDRRFSLDLIHTVRGVGYRLALEEGA